jgi:hypothetical protein
MGPKNIFGGISPLVLTTIETALEAMPLRKWSPIKDTETRSSPTSLQLTFRIARLQRSSSVQGGLQPRTTSPNECQDRCLALFPGPARLIKTAYHTRDHKSRKDF